MSSTDSPKPLLIRVKRKANEDKSLPNKRCKFIGTTDSPKDEDIYRLVSQMSANKSVLQTDDKQNIEIKDFEEWNPNKSIKPKESESDLNQVLITRIGSNVSYFGLNYGLKPFS